MCFFQRLVMYNSFFAFSVAVKKARFICEDGSYMGRIEKITMENSLIWSIDLFPNYSFLITKRYTSEILTRVEPGVQNWDWDKPQNRGLYSRFASKVCEQFIALRDWNSAKFRIMRLLKQNIVTFRLYQNNFSMWRCNVFPCGRL